VGAVALLFPYYDLTHVCEVRYTTWKKEEPLPQNCGKTISVKKNINDVGNKIIIENLVARYARFLPKL
jgi:hypothetical protein